MEDNAWEREGEREGFRLRSTREEVEEKRWGGITVARRQKVR